MWKSSQLHENKVGHLLSNLCRNLDSDLLKVKFETIKFDTKIPTVDDQPYWS